MVIFNSYVSLPEVWLFPIRIWTDFGKRLWEAIKQQKMGLIRIECEYIFKILQVGYVIEQYNLYDFGLIQVALIWHRKGPPS